MKTILLIDLSGIFWAAWHGGGSEAPVSQAFEQTLGKIHSLSSGFDHVAICVDFPPYRRKERAPSYKANREAAPPQAIAQLVRTKARLEADGLCIWEAKGYEADDVIATACEMAKHETQPIAITIASSDKDLLALVDDSRGITTLSPMSGTRYDEAGVVAKFGIPPKLIPDFLALVGDKSDGIEGVRGVGPANAVKLLQAFGDVLGVLDGAEPEMAAAVGAKLGAATFAAKDAIRLACDLVKLETNAPIDFDAVFERRDPKPLGPAGEWDEAEFDEVLPPVKPVEPEKPADAIEVMQAQNEPRALAIPSKITTLAPRSAQWSEALEPSSAKEAWIVAKYIFDSRLFPQLGSQAAVFAVVLRGRALGLDAVTACSMFHNVKGRLVMYAELIVGLVMRSGKAQYFRCLETDDTHAVFATKRVGDDHEVKLSWDVDRAIRAGLLERRGDKIMGRSNSGAAGNWDMYRRTMLRWRCSSELAHAVYPDVVSGLVTPDEVEGLNDAAE